MINNINYKNKYIKYKIKYIKLKNKLIQVGNGGKSKHPLTQFHPKLSLEPYYPKQKSQTLFEKLLMSNTEKQSRTLIKQLTKQPIDVIKSTRNPPSRGINIRPEIFSTFKSIEEPTKKQSITLIKQPTKQPVDLIKSKWNPPSRDINIRQEIFSTFKSIEEPFDVQSLIELQNATESTISDRHFGDSLKNIMTYINKPYERGTVSDPGQIPRLPKSGIYYSEDYINIHSISNYEFDKLNGISNDRVFELTWKCNFMSKPYILPSDALNLFIIGPTFADCGNVIQICIYKYIYDLVGKDKFNQLFGKEINRLLITPHLFDPLTTIYNDRSYSLIGPITASGNPLLILFDKITDLDISQLQHGDIIHIKGVDDYGFKHLAGFAPGWNLICIKDDTTTKFMGFGPIQFQQPLTYAEIKTILIQEYNKNQSFDTKERIKQFSSSPVSSSVDITMSTNTLCANLAIQLENDYLSLDSEIGGIICGIRLNKIKLNDFIRSENNSWTNLAISATYDEQISRLVLTPVIDNSYLIPFTRETENKTFENYNRSSSELESLFQTALKFAQAIIINENSRVELKRPLGLLISGNPGIGKTHLSVSIGKYINQYGKKLLFVDESYITKQYNLANGREINYTEKFNDSKIDLIIIDDTNIQEIGRMIITSALKYVFEQNKAIVITSNNDINSFVVYLPQFFNYNDPIRNNFKYIRNLQLQSQRTPWTDTIRNKTLIDLFGYNDSKASGIIIEAGTKDINNLTKYKTELENLYNPRMLSVPSMLPIPCILPKIRIADTPYDAITQRVKDMYVYDACLFDYIILNVYD